MKKTISFKKNLEFPTMIGEVTAISLDHNLKFIDENNITGDLKVTGRYKMTEASRLEENFDYQLPVEIILTEKLDLETAKVDIEDFYYELENDDTMNCYIDVKVEGVEIVDTLDDENDDVRELEEVDIVRQKVVDEIKEDRCIEEEGTEDKKDCPTSLALEQFSNNEVEVEKNITNILDTSREQDEEQKQEMENNEMTKVEKETQTNINQEVGSLFSSFKDSDETFATYSVYILRQEETIQTVIEKYHTTKEELEKYNDLTNLTIGTKLIIPTFNE